MNIEEAISVRRSIRKYISKPVEDEKLEKVLEAARLAPSARNSQDWRFIVVRDPDTIKKLIPACGGQQFIGEAPVFIAACSTVSSIMTCGQPTGSVDLSIAMSFMILEACEQGLGTCWLGNFDNVELKKALAVPENVNIVAVTPLGYPAESPNPRPRKTFDEVVSFEHF